MWGEIFYPFPNFNGATFEVWEWISTFIPQFIVDVITLSILGFKLNHISKMGHMYLNLSHVAYGLKQDAIQYITLILAVTQLCVY